MKHLLALSVALFISLAIPGFAAQPEVRINNDACLSGTGQAGIEACIELADAIGRDLYRLNANALALEELGRHESAARLYAAAAAWFADDRRALQGLIRSRANARATRIITDIVPQSIEVSPCWTERWMRALAACQQEVARHPGNARLQERLGDVARSVGDAASAQAAYARSLALSPDNENLHRKRNALTLLLAGSAAPSARPVTVAAETSAPAAPDVEQAVERMATPTADIPIDQPAAASDAATIRQLELLEALKARNLVDAREYQDRRSALLAAAFGGAVPNPPAVRYRGLVDGRYFAVVIGNDRYAEFPRLETAVADANAVSDVLRTHYGFQVTTLNNASRYEILSALSELRKQATAADNILVYYAGHGLLDQSAGRGYWLPVDAEPGNFAQWISTNDIAGVFAGAEAKHALVIADSCFAGALLRAGDTTGLETLERLAAKRSRTVLTSGGLEPVIDDGDGTHSVFAVALLDALTANDTVLEASKLFTTVRDRVVRSADQTPQYAPMQMAGHDGGDFLFIPKTLSSARGTY